MYKTYVFKYIHKVHHDSNTTSPFTSFSFHPVERFLQAIILPITLLIVLLNVYVLFVQLIIMTLNSVINHLEIEIYPKYFHRHFAGKWIIGARHHSLHKINFKYNFGLYFTFWGKWKKNVSPKHPRILEKK